MIEKANTPLELAEYLDDYLLKHGAADPGRAFAGASEAQIRMIIEALRRPPVLRTTSHG